MPPSRCCSSVNRTLKSTLKSLPSEDAQGNVHPIRRLYACSFARGARDTAESVTSWLARWTTKPLKPSAIAEPRSGTNEEMPRRSRSWSWGPDAANPKSIAELDPTMLSRRRPVRQTYRFMPWDGLGEILPQTIENVANRGLHIDALLNIKR